MVKNLLWFVLMMANAYTAICLALLALGWAPGLAVPAALWWPMVAVAIVDFVVVAGHFGRAVSRG